MLNFYGFKSIKDLHGDFKTKLNEIIAEQKKSEKMSNTFTPKDMKQFFSFLKSRAVDERDARTNRVIYREYKPKTFLSLIRQLFDKNGYREHYKRPFDIELETLLYDEMAKFFDKERLNLFDSMHRSRGKK